jgi:hypothetical protein
MYKRRWLVVQTTSERRSVGGSRSRALDKALKLEKSPNAKKPPDDAKMAFRAKSTKTPLQPLDLF